MQTFEKYLNPLYKDIEEVVDFSKIVYKTPLEEEEYPHLQKVSLITKKRLDFLLPNLKRLEEELERQIEEIDAESDADEKKAARSIYNKILIEIEITVGRINNELVALDSPYFGKIVFLPDDSRTKVPLSLYIGKFAMVDKDTHLPLITDWRSPIANIYYQNSGPKKNVSFTAPVGERKGELVQKRQFQISRARIRGIYDAKSGNVAADEFLLVQLQERIGKKLQDIVATIQAQQNDIIREDIDFPVVIQGVAGSGKTTILLHRLAYLFYTYSKKINDTNSLIIAPNQMFIDYVSDVLPNLGVRKVETLTYLFWAKKILEWDDYYTVSTEEENLEFKEFKGSREFIKILDKYFHDFEENLLENIPSSMAEVIADRYHQLKEEYSDIDMIERVSLATEYAFAQKKFNQYREGDIKLRTENTEEIKAKILAYFRRETNIYQLYKNLFKSRYISKDISKYTLEGLKHSGRIRTYRIEDLAPMVYLHLKVYGSKLYERAYIMIDEAQDMSFVQLATLSKIAKNGNMTIAGDLAQSIIPPFYIKSWDEVFEVVKENTKKDTSYHQLQKCYRTTVEIVDFANKIFKEYFPKSYDLPEALLRHGEKVKIIKKEKNIIDMDKSDVKEIVEMIKEYFEKGSVTCALLARNREHARELYEIFKPYEDEINRDVVNYSENDYRTGLLILPIENAKGLEFDSVIIADANSDYYKDDLLSIKLLYVAITRALHRLCVITKEGDNFSKKFNV